jgi:organic radical activating enzyme
MNKYKKIKSSNDGLFLEVELGNYCNYTCSYCMPSVYSGTDWIDYNKLCSFIDKVKPKHVLLGGGEPTTYPKINPLLIFLKSKGIITDIISNGSRSLNWWVTNSKYLDIITLSFHLEYANVFSFKEILKYLTETKIVTINVPMIPERFSECHIIAKQLSKIKNTFVSLKALTNYETQELYKYTDDQLIEMSNIMKPKDKTTVNKNSVTIKGFNIDGKEEKTTAQKLISEKNNRFKSWLCWKGISYLRLKYNGDLFRSACEQPDGAFLNIYNDFLELPKDPSICNKDYCFCLTDLKTIDKVKL